MKGALFIEQVSLDAGAAGFTLAIACLLSTVEPGARIVEVGTHAERFTRNGAYTNLHSNPFCGVAA